MLKGFWKFVSCQIDILKCSYLELLKIINLKFLVDLIAVESMDSCSCFICFKEVARTLRTVWGVVDLIVLNAICHIIINE